MVLIDYRYDAHENIWYVNNGFWYNIVHYRHCFYNKILGKYLL